MWPNTIVSNTLKIKYPIIQAPMAGSTTPELVSAVSNAGALGSYAGGYATPNNIKIAIQKIKTLTNKPFAVNLFIPSQLTATKQQIEHTTKLVQNISAELNIDIELPTPPYTPSFEEQLNVVLEERVPVFSFTFGVLNSNHIKALKDNKTILIGTATQLKEAQILEESGIDMIVAQGIEAGGHRGSFIDIDQDGIPLMPLLTKFHHHIKIPIIAAGGIMDAKKIMEVMQLGASAVQIGTAFLTCIESGAHLKHKEILLNAKEDLTVLTNVFSGKTARGIENKFIKEMTKHSKNILPYPIQNALTQALRVKASKQNNSDFMSMWAGQGMAACKEVKASELIAQLNQSMMQLLKTK